MVNVISSRGLNDGKQYKEQPSIRSKWRPKIKRNRNVFISEHGWLMNAPRLWSSWTIPEQRRGAGAVGPSHRENRAGV
jgi:hypothetical protein